MNGVLRFRAWCGQVCFVLAAILLVFSVAIMAAQVGMRAIFNQPMIWVEEAVRYLFVWVVYLGTVVGVINGTHIRVLAAVEPFGRPARVMSDWLTRVVDFVCFAFLFWWGIDLALKYREAEFYTLPGWPQVWFFYAALPIPAGLCVLFTLLPGEPAEDAPGETRL